MRIKRALAVGALVVGGSVTAFGVSTVTAASQCTIANFTVNGVFDQEGYLACLAAAGGGTGLPGTGNDSLQSVGIAASMLLVGGALAVSAQRRRAADLEQPTSVSS